jgi:charged multivesicular body protein 2A
MAKDLVRTRRYVKKFMLMKANIQAVSLKIQTLRSQNAMAQAMKGVTKAMQNMNRQVIWHCNIFLYNIHLNVLMPLFCKC